MSELAGAILAAQKELPAIHKDSTAEVVGKTKDGKPYRYSYGYLSLQRLLEIVVPVLNKNGLALTQVPTIHAETGRPVLRSSLMHVSGETLTADTPLIVSGNETPQTWGGAVTYARRYALTALLGIAADEDDDGVAASEAPKKASAQKAVVAHATAGQKNRLHAIIAELAKQRGVDPEQVRSALKGAIGIESFTKLTAEQADRADALLADWQKKVGAAA